MKAQELTNKFILWIVKKTKRVIQLLFYSLSKIFDILVQLIWVLVEFVWGVLQDIFLIILDIFRVFDRFGIIDLFFANPNDTKKDK